MPQYAAHRRVTASPGPVTSRHPRPPLGPPKHLPAPVKELHNLERNRMKSGEVPPITGGHKDLVEMRRNCRCREAGAVISRHGTSASHAALHTPQPPRPPLPPLSGLSQPQHLASLTNPLAKNELLYSKIGHFQVVNTPILWNAKK